MPPLEISVDKLNNVYDGWTATAAHTLDADGLMFRSSGEEVIVIRHDGGAETGTVILKSVEDPYKRTGDITVQLSSGDVKAIGPIKQIGFMDSSGMVTIMLEANISNVIVAYILKPSN